MSPSPLLPAQRRWLWLAVGGTLLVQLYLCFFFSFGRVIPITSDVNPSNYHNLRFQIPPAGWFSTDYWFGFPQDPVPLTPTSILAHLPVWLFFTGYYPLFGALAVLGFYLMLREWRLDFWPALVAGLIYGWQGPMLSNIYGGHFSPIAMLAIIPFAVLLSWRAMRQGSFYCAAAAGALVGLIVTLQPDQGALVAMVIGSLFLVQAGLEPHRRLRTWWKPVAQLATTVIVAALVALPMLQTMFTTQISGVRQGGSDDPQERWEWATQWSYPPEQILEYLAPGVLGWGSGFENGPYWGRMGRSAGWEESNQGFRSFSISTWPISTIGLLLAIIGGVALFRRSPELETQRVYGYFFAIVAIVCWLLAFGKFAPFYRLFYELPLMSTWRNPVKFLIPGNLCLVILAGVGCQWMMSRLGEQNQAGGVRRWLPAGLAVIGTCLIVGWVVAVAMGKSVATSLAAEGFGPAEIGSAHATMMLALLVAGALVLVFAGVWAWLRTQPVARRSALAGGLLMLLIVPQMIWVHRHYLQPFNFRAAYQSNALIDKLRSADEPVRVKVIPGDGILHHYLSTLLPYYGIASIDVPAVSRIPEDYATFFEALAGQPQRLWDLGGVRYVVCAANAARQLSGLPGFQENVKAVYGYRASGTSLETLDMTQVLDINQATHLVFELKDYLPKISLVPRLEILPDEPAVAERLAAPDWDPRKALLVTASTALTGPSATATASPAPRNAVTKLLRYDPQTIEVAIETDQPGFLLVNDRFDGGWQARVGGATAPVVPCNLLLRGVPIPAGSSRVSLTFRRPHSGVAISLVVLVGLIAAAPLARRRR